ncbi:AAA family ATPase [Candidatus Micrarchaeota archaeon]|nr:AAA family ATPase [Candidatus Micrarchaeota archaeon]
MKPSKPNDSYSDEETKSSPSFKEILSYETIFNNLNTLSPHFVPDILPHREEYITKIMKHVAPAIKGFRPQNLFIYGKPGTGKTCSIKKVIQKFREVENNKGKIEYINCRTYNSRYRIIQRIVQRTNPEVVKGGFGLTYLYEKLVNTLNQKTIIIIVLDEIDMVKDLDDLLYTLTRLNDEAENGGISIIGIANKTDFKKHLEQRSLSSLNDNEMIFPPYNAEQIKSILTQRVKLAFAKGVVDESAINLTAAITSSENGDARYALKLLARAGYVAEEMGIKKITDKEVQIARKNVEEDIIKETISTLPDHQQITLYGIAKLSLTGSKYRKLGETQGFFFSGEVYEEYINACEKFGRKPRSARWHQEYLNDLESLGLITMIYSGKGVRGHTKLIKIGYSPEVVIKVIDKNFELGLISNTEGD